MPVEYNWVGDNEDLAKLKRESRRGEWEAVGERKRKGEAEKGGGQRGTAGAEVSGRISHNILTLSDLRAKKWKDELACQNR